MPEEAPTASFVVVCDGSEPGTIEDKAGSKGTDTEDVVVAESERAGLLGQQG